MSLVLQFASEHKIQAIMPYRGGRSRGKHAFCQQFLHACSKLKCCENTPPPYTEKCNFTAQEMAPNLPCEDGVREAVPAGDLK